MTMGPVTGHVTAAAAAVTSEDNPVMTEVDIHEAAADQENTTSFIGAKLIFYTFCLSELHDRNTGCRV